MKDVMHSKLNNAEIRVKELVNSGDLKKITESESINISQFYGKKSNNRLETAKLISTFSKEKGNYSDYSESVSAAYYSMYYIVHSFIASEYKVKLREHVRGVHSITANLVLYYLVNTNKLTQHLYEEYLKTLDEVSRIQDISIEEFRKDAFEIAESYDHVRDSREIFTYFVSKNAEEHHAENTIKVAEEFINTIKQLMLK